MHHAGRWMLRSAAPLLLGSGGPLCSRTPPRPTITGTDRMADTLAVLYRQAVANPEANPFLNDARAAKLKARVAYENGNQALNTRMALGMEHLMAGQSREAIADFQVV